MEISKGNIFEGISQTCDQEVFDDLFAGNGVRIERIVSTGQCSDKDFWYDQQQAEWVMVLEGDAVIEFEDNEQVKLSKGDYVFIEAHRKHRVASTKAGDMTVWLAVHIKV
ncbi:MAG: cupin domain-containing protein [Sedimentisphaeraceae bacterium JB056]